nr:MAG TPA: hypothetical protein [Caudoviricetes sp.]
MTLLPNLSYTRYRLSNFKYACILDVYGKPAVMSRHDVVAVSWTYARLLNVC